MQIEVVGGRGSPCCGRNSGPGVYEGPQFPSRPSPGAGPKAPPRSGTGSRFPSPPRQSPLPGPGMEAPAELLATLPLLGTALALLLASLWFWRSRACALGSSEALNPPKQARPSAGAEETQTFGEAPYELEEPRAGAGKKEEELKEEEERQNEEPNSESKKMSLLAKLEEEDEEEAFSFKYSPGKLRGNQYKKMLTKEELEEEQRIELTSDFTCL
ncbi:matrix-remodeling-associated protein 7 isoform X2 [Antechinus flavipes]|uniref:matrix-remodeling-associated protein 7 isoform X2 n=1 Tax=Antechinus flavipes TaxID=38775 RepID=UPI002235716A|nr:matrix-remodeling-associated protein 7 isoform X2 [Antechinus flavipes]